MLATNKINTTNEYMDLVISESRPSVRKRLQKNYRICTLTKNQTGQRYINLRVPAEIQDKIIAAYEEGKTVRIFA